MWSIYMFSKSLFKILLYPFPAILKLKAMIYPFNRQEIAFWHSINLSFNAFLELKLNAYTRMLKNKK